MRRVTGYIGDPAGVGSVYPEKVHLDWLSKGDALLYPLALQDDLAHESTLEAVQYAAGL